MRLIPLLALVLSISACDDTVQSGTDAAVRDAGPSLDTLGTPDSGPPSDVGPDADEPPRDRVTDDCRFYSARQDAFIPLYGDVEFVSNFADFQVEEVTAFSDLDVELVDAFPDRCGEWREVTAFPDFTVERVNNFSDFDIRYVTAFPGLP